MKRNEKYNIKFALSIAITKNLFLFKGNLYEKLDNHPYQEQYRIFLGNDYDYLEDKELIKELNDYPLWEFRKMNNN